MNEQRAGTKGHFGLARVTDAWYVACRSEDLGSAPIARTILDTPIVLFRGQDGRAAALLDRCAHRNVPLSMGSCEAQRLVCGYHGWAYDSAGVVQEVPALEGEKTGKARCVPAFAVREQQGFVWVWARADAAPYGEPFRIRELDDPVYGAIRYEAEAEGSLLATLENILDVPHTAFLHRGLFRSGPKNKITAVVRRGPDRVEAEYLGEPRPTGLIGRVLAPRGGTVVHFDRFRLPSIAEVEYRLDDNHLVVTTLCTPVKDFVTMMYSVACFRLRLPHAVVSAVLRPLAMKVVAQDLVMLKAQSEAVQRFGGEQFVSTDVDLLAPHILRLLKRAERGELGAEDAAPVEERVELRT